MATVPCWRGWRLLFAVQHGERRARENKRTKSVLAAFRFLAKPNRQYRGIRSRAEILLAADEETSLIGTAFSKAGLHEEEFLKRLTAVVDGRPEDRSRIAAIAADIFPHLSAPRGRKITAASAAYEFIRGLSPDLAKVNRRRRIIEQEDQFIDPLAEATRREFQDPTFSPRSARRRLKREKTRPPSERKAG